MSDVQLTVSQRRTLDLQKENLVSAAEAFLAPVARNSSIELSKSQLSQLLAVANETESPAVVLNYIRYQTGRDKQRKAWAYNPRRGQPTLGEILIDAIQKGAVEKAVLATEDLDETQKQLARMHMLRHFLGFIRRHLIYLKGDKDDK